MCKEYAWCNDVCVEEGAGHGSDVEAVAAWGGQEVRAFISTYGGSRPCVTLEAGDADGGRARVVLDLNPEEAREVAAALHRMARMAAADRA